MKIYEYLLSEVLNKNDSSKQMNIAIAKMKVTLSFKAAVVDINIVNKSEAI